MNDVRIEEFDAASAPEELLEQWYAIDVATTEHDLPTEPLPQREELFASLRQAPRPGERKHRWFAYAGEQAAGAVILNLMDPPNETQAWIGIHVRPEYRRRGIGSVLHARALSVVTAAGRVGVLTEVPEGSPGEAFAHRHGYVGAQREPQSLSRLAGIDPALLAEIAGRDHGGYRLARWTARVPDEHVASYAVAKRAMADAPTGETGWETPTWDVERVREGERRTAERGLQWYGTFALAPDGTVAGLTELSIDPRRPARAGQDDTSVVPAHRGHGLGLWMKADMIARLRDDHPATTEIVTWNAETNEHMLAINRALGFAVELWWINLRRDLSA